MQQYFISLPMNVFGVNLMSNSYVVGLPSLTGINGFATALNLDAIRNGLDYSLEGWAIAFHEVTAYESKPGLSLCYPGANVNSGVSDEFKARGFANLTLYLEVTTNIDISSLTSFINKRLSAMRFCSGSISIPKGDSVSYCDHNRVDFCKHIIRAGKGRPQFFVEDYTEELQGDRFKDLLKKIMRPKTALYEGGKEDLEKVRKQVIKTISAELETPKAFEAVAGALIEHAPELSDLFGGDDIETLWNFEKWMSLAYPEKGKATDLGKALKKALSKVGVKPKSDDDVIEQARLVWEQMKGAAEKAICLYRNNGDEEPYLGYMVPVQVGFVAISQPEVKDNVRLLSNGDEPEHCYVEPQIGLARMRTHYSVISAFNNDEFPNIFWRGDVIKTNPSRPEFNISGY